MHTDTFCLHTHTYTAPDRPPQNVMGTNTSSTSLLITWQEPPLEFQNGDITSYIISYNISGNNALPMENSTSSTTIELVGLEIFTFYEIRVSAVTVEEGPLSAAIEVQTDSDSTSLFLFFYTCTYSHLIFIYSLSLSLSHSLTSFLSHIHTIHRTLCSPVCDVHQHLIQLCQRHVVTSNDGKRCY